ncbi:MAG: NHL repeat-containing protein [Chloroflexota bacterium]
MSRASALDRLATDPRFVEMLGLLALFIIAILTRRIGVGDVEGNLLPDETDHLATMYRILAGYGPGPFDLSWDGNPAFQLYPSLPFLRWFDDGYLGLRASVTMASLLTLGAFYVVCRKEHGVLAAFTATGLMAGCHWMLFFSRNGEVNIFIALYLLLAFLGLQMARDTTRPWPWAWTGFWCGMGWYGFLAGVFILPTILLTLPFMRVAGHLSRRRIAILLAVFALTMLPRAPVLLRDWPLVQQYIDGRAVYARTAAEDLPQTVLTQASRVARAFVILDPTLEGNKRYLAPGRAVLDATTGTLYVIGLGIAIWTGPTRLPLVMLAAVPVLATQILTINTPDIARAIGALPAAFLLVGLTVERAQRWLPLTPLVQAAFIVAVPFVAVQNWQGYAAWQRTPAARDARQPAIEYAEFDAWQHEHLDRAAHNERGMTVTEWRAEHPAPTTSRGGRPARPAMTASAGLDVRRQFESTAFTGNRPLRGVAVSGSGAAFAMDQSGRLWKLDVANGTAEPAGSAPAGNAQAWDLALAPDDSVLILDSERGVVLRQPAGSRTVATLGADWGMYRPRGIDVGPDGRIYVADTGKNRVVVASPEGKLLSSIGAESAGSDLFLDQPTDVAVTEDGRILVAIPERGQLVVVSEEGARLDSWTIGKSDTLNGAHIAVASNGLVAVTEPAQRRVRFLDTSGRELAKIEGELASPVGIAAVDGLVIVADTGAGRAVGFALVSR